MKLSGARKQELYGAIADKIMGLRLDVLRRGFPKEVGETLDAKLFDLTNDIWRSVHKTLNLDGHP